MKKWRERKKNQLRRHHCKQKYFCAQVRSQLKAFLHWLVALFKYRLLPCHFLHQCFIYTLWTGTEHQRAQIQRGKKFGYFEHNICILRLFGISEFCCGSNRQSERLCTSLRGNRSDQACKTKLVAIGRIEILLWLRVNTNTTCIQQWSHIFFSHLKSYANHHVKHMLAMIC